MWTLAEIDQLDAKPSLADFRELLSRHELHGGIVFSHMLSDGHRYAVRFDGTRTALPQNEVNELSLLSQHALDVDRHGEAVAEGDGGRRGHGSGAYGGRAGV